jgi:hypothetical protein
MWIENGCQPSENGSLSAAWGPSFTIDTRCHVLRASSDGDGVTFQRFNSMILLVVKDLKFKRRIGVSVIKGNVQSNVIERLSSLTSAHYRD